MKPGERIRYYRESAGLTQDEVAKKINVTPQAVYKYEKGIVSNIPLDKIELLASLFSVSPSVLAGWEDCPQKETTTPAEAELLALHRQLNDEGQGRLLEYADDLVSSGKYIKSDPLGLVAK